MSVQRAVRQAAVMSMALPAAVASAALAAARAQSCGHAVEVGCDVSRRPRWMIPTVATVVMAMVVTLGAVAIAALTPALARVAPPPVPQGPAVTSVAAVKPHIVIPDDPARRAFTPTATRWPAPVAASMTPALAVGSALGERASAAGTPLWAQRVAGAGTVGVRLLDRATTDAAGLTGVLFTMSGSGRLRVGLNYTGFAQAYGGNYGSRLRLVELPACATTTPARAQCQSATPLDSTNDLADRSVSAVVDLGATGTATTVLAAVASDPGTEGGSAGTYAATELKPSGTWAAGGSTGSFTYDYPIGAPPATSVLTPQLALSYSSAAADGQTAATQAQSSWVGQGWSAPSSYIEQSFVSCSGSPEGTAAPVFTPDKCYDGPVLDLVLKGSSSALVWDAGQQTWRPEADSGSIVKRITGSGNGSGTYNTDYWTVTDRSGTVYSFGRNQLPGWTSGKPTTSSVDYEPVYSAHSGDPCYSASGWSSSVCTMAYRWNLDYVTDVHGDAMSYYYKQDVNYYGQNKGARSGKYIRDSHLDRIDYGFADGSAYATVPDQVVFTTGDRCLSGTCQPLTSANKANWPDVPYDLICASGATCAAWGPGFFSTVRLSSIVTRQWSTASSQYAPVDTYALTQTIPPSGDATAPTLWLSAIQHTGNDLSAGGSGAITLPSVSFTGVPLANRVDTLGDGLPAFYKYRLATITTESGSVISVTYDRPNPCTAPVTVSPASNTLSCYPVSWTPSGALNPFTDWFNKYAATKVTSTDPFGGAPALATSYAYFGGAAWHFDDNELVKAKYRTYGQFRGYAKVQTRTGDGVNDPPTLSETTYYRGMSKNNNSTVVNLTDSAGGLHEDVDQFAGSVLEETSYLGDGGAVDHSTISSYWLSPATATRARTGLSALTANLVAPVLTYARQAVTTGGTTTWRVTATDTAYDGSTGSATFGLPTLTYSHAVPAVAAFDRCSRNSYAPANTAKNIVGLVSEAETDSVKCGGYTAGTPASVPGSINTLTAPTTVSRPDQVVAAARTFYDDPAWSTTFPQTAAPTRGETTMVRQASGYTAGAFTWQTKSRSAYDGYGRVVAAFDGRDKETQTAYTTNAVGLTTATTTTNPLGQSTSSTFSPLRGLNLTATDANHRVTTTTYDALGRVSSMWLHDRSPATAANYLFAYSISNTAATTTTTKKLNDSGGYVTSTQIYDGLLRERQNQAMTPAGGRMVTDTFYDTRGWVRQKNNGWWDPATTPNSTLVAPTGLNPVSALPNQDMYGYDGLGRVIYDRSEQDNQVVSTTTTVYNGDRTTTIPPAGGITTTTVTDLAGRTSELDQYSAAPTLHTPANTFTGGFYLTGGTATAVSYGFDGHGNQSMVTEPGPHTWTSAYNLLGQQTTKTDPDGGISNTLYDADGNITQLTDARNKAISYTFDDLNRQTGQYAATLGAQAPANQLSKWVYDNSDNAVPGMAYAIGQQTTATAYASGNAYIYQQTGFNVFGSSLGTTVTIPAVEGALAGAYTFGHVYTATAGLLLKDTYPAGGGLPAETVLHGYTSALDLPNTLLGLTGYGQGVSYDAWGRVTQATVNPLPNQASLTNTWDPHTGRLLDSLLTRTTVTPSRVDEQAYRYDLGGNITRQTSTRLDTSSPTETQCFQYNPLDQLTQAWTATDACAATPTTASHAMVSDALGAASAYWTSWSVDGLANRTAQTAHNLGTGADTTTAYAYNGNGANQPHTLTSTATTGATTGSTSYGYDQTGNMTNRNTGQGAQTLVWNDAGRLVAVNGSTGGNSTFVYDANGNLLLQKDPGTTTLTLPGQLHTLNTATGVVIGSRYYTLPGISCIRTGPATTAYTYAVLDRRGTPALYLDNTAQVPGWRLYTPYGAPRGTGLTAPDNHGFLDKPVDTGTGLTEVGARDYDPQAGRFVSLDPVFDPKNPQQLNGYSYTGANPVMQSDPTGTRPADCDSGCMKDFTTSQLANIRGKAGYGNWCVGTGHFGPCPKWGGCTFLCGGGSTSCLAFITVLCKATPTIKATPTPAVPAMGPDLRYRQLDYPYGAQCDQPSDYTHSGCAEGKSILYECSDKECSNHETPDMTCSLSVTCLISKLTEIIGYGSAIGIGAPESSLDFIIDELHKYALEQGLGLLPGAEPEDPKYPTSPADAGSTFAPVVLGFNTALYQSTGAGETRDSSNPVYSPVPPGRTGTQTTGHELIFHEGTVVWEGMVNGIRLVVVPPDNPGTEVVTWPLK